MIPRRDSASNLSPVERRRVISCLDFGPWKLLTSDGTPAGKPRVDDDELLEAWESWAHLEAPSHARPAWDERTYGYWRFVEGLEPLEAFAAARQARGRRLT